MTAASTKRGIILFAHGSRDPLWHQPIEAVAAQIAILSPTTPVVCAYLELSTPDLPSAMRALLAHDVCSVTILPLFIGVGKHAREDLPRLVKDLRAIHPGVQFNLQSAVGEDTRLVQLLAEIALASH